MSHRTAPLALLAAAALAIPSASLVAQGPEAPQGPQVPWNAGPLKGALGVIGMVQVKEGCGFADDGMPIAMQLASAPRRDSVVLQVAHAYESATPWRQKRPPEPRPPVA